jgi:hypothetical protein
VLRRWSRLARDAIAVRVLQQHAVHVSTQRTASRALFAWRRRVQSRAAASALAEAASQRLVCFCFRALLRFSRYCWVRRRLCDAARSLHALHALRRAFKSMKMFYWLACTPKRLSRRYPCSFLRYSLVRRLVRVCVV